MTLPCAPDLARLCALEPKQEQLWKTESVARVFTHRGSRKADFLQVAVALRCRLQALDAESCCDYLRFPTSLQRLPIGGLWRFWESQSANLFPNGVSRLECRDDRIEGSGPAAHFDQYLSCASTKDCHALAVLVINRRPWSANLRHKRNNRAHRVVVVGLCLEVFSPDVLEAEPFVWTLMLAVGQDDVARRKQRPFPDLDFGNATKRLAAVGRVRNPSIRVESLRRGRGNVGPLLAMQRLVPVWARQSRHPLSVVRATDCSCAG